MTARVTSGLLVSALIRRVDQEGGAAVVVARGDATAGSILLSLCEKGTFYGFRERLLDGDGRYKWQAIGPSDERSDASRMWLARRRARDPDLWVVELDIANAQRLVAEMSGDG